MATDIVFEIKRIINEKQVVGFELKHLPVEEARVFLNVLNQYEKFLVKFDPIWLNNYKGEIKKWFFVYLLLHDLLHSEVKEQDLTKLEILTTAPIFNNYKDIIGDVCKNLISAYFILGLGALRTNHSLKHLVSEKIILGEFVSIGGLEMGIWGFKLEENLLPIVAKNILEKTEKDRHHLLIEKYKNFTFDFI